MLQNYHLLQYRANIPISQVHFIQKYLYNHEVDAISSLVSNLRSREGTIIGAEAQNGMSYRQSDIRWIEWNDENWWLYTKLTQKVNEINSQLWNFDLFGINEYIQYAEYNGNNSSRGHYDWHIDVGSQGLESTRKLTIEIVLDSDYNGGELSFLLGPTENRVRLEKGDIVVYPSFVLNKVYPVLSGIRKSIVCWISGPSFK